MNKQNTNLTTNQQGIAHLLGLVLLVLVVAVIGFGGYQVYNNGKEDSAESSLSTEASDLPVVQEGEDKTGEILPPTDTEPEEPVDIDGNDPSQTGAAN